MLKFLNETIFIAQTFLTKIFYKTTRDSIRDFYKRHEQTVL